MKIGDYKVVFGKYPRVRKYLSFSDFSIRINDWTVSTAVVCDTVDV